MRLSSTRKIWSRRAPSIHPGRSLQPPLLCSLLCTLAWLPLISQAATPQKLYTKAQAHAGAKVYSQVCSTCHGSKLQGERRPP